MITRRIIGLVGLVALLFSVAIGIAQQSTVDCPPEGTAKRARAQELNRLKNRDHVPDSAIIRDVTLEELLRTSAPGRGTLRITDAVRVTAYVADVRIAGPESCNCMRSDHWYRDTHIELTMHPMQASDKSKLVVAEVTPRFRDRMKARGIDWSQRALRDAFHGRWVRITGWLFFDEVHDDESANSSDGDHIWRGTAWEIHPVTDIVVVDGPNTKRQLAPASTDPVSVQCRAVTAKGSRCTRRTTNADGRCWQHR